jgi:hypothetical protein
MTGSGERGADSRPVPTPPERGAGSGERTTQPNPFWDWLGWVAGLRSPLPAPRSPSTFLLISLSKRAYEDGGAAR